MPPLMLDLARRARKRLSDPRAEIAYWTTRARRWWVRRGQPVGKARPFGVNLVGFMRAEIGLGTAARGLAAALRTAGIPFEAINLDISNLDRQGEVTWSHMEGTSASFAFTLICGSPEMATQARRVVPRGALCDSFVIGNWYWETDRLPPSWHRELACVDEVWAPSAFVGRAFRNATRKPVQVVHPVVTAPAPQRSRRADFGLPANRFLFLTMASIHSVLERKNPVGALQAFRTAFPLGQIEAALVVRITHAAFASDEVKHLFDDGGIGIDVFVVDESLTSGQVLDLVSSCDALVSLHRAEGFGLAPAEAMSLGKPVIVTGWSGTMDFTTSANAALVGYRLVQPDPTLAVYGGRGWWAEPDVDQAAKLMRSLVADRDQCRRLGALGRATMVEHYSAEVIGATILARLRAIAATRPGLVSSDPHGIAGPRGHQR
jgi:glycosyltransferase involved in cell wall biosynthesis